MYSAFSSGIPKYVDIKVTGKKRIVALLMNKATLVRRSEKLAVLTASSWKFFCPLAVAFIAMGITTHHLHQPVFLVKIILDFAQRIQTDDVFEPFEPHSGSRAQRDAEETLRFYHLGHIAVSKSVVARLAGDPRIFQGCYRCGLGLDNAVYDPNVGFIVSFEDTQLVTDPIQLIDVA